MTTETIEWIACADRLPEPSPTRLLLLYVKYGESSFAIPGYRAAGHWIDAEDDNEAVSEPVTHWAAWPGGPKG